MNKMPERKVVMCSILVTLLPVVLGLYHYNDLPEMVAVHFGFSGNADTYMSRLTGIILPPIFLSLIQLAAFETARVSIRQKRNVNPRGVYFIMWLIAVLSLTMNMSIIYFNMGMNLDITKFAVIFSGIVFIIIGNYLPKNTIFSSENINLPKRVRLMGCEKEFIRMFSKTFVLAGLTTTFSAMFNVQVAIVILLFTGVVLMAEVLLIGVLFGKKKQ